MWKNIISIFSPIGYFRSASGQRAWPYGFSLRFVKDISDNVVNSPFDDDLKNFSTSTDSLVQDINSLLD